MTRSRHALVSAAVILALFITGCAKQPAVTQAAAPPPTGAPVAAAPAPPAAAAPAPAPAAPAPPVVTARPAPRSEERRVGHARTPHRPLTPRQHATAKQRP